MTVRLVWVSLALLLVPLVWPHSVQARSQVIYKGKSTCRDIAFTFDVEFGPATQSLIDTIDSLRLKTTWFFLADGVPSQAGIVQQVAANHEIGNHTVNHPVMSRLSAADMSAQIRRAESIIASVAGRSPQPFFRPPYGEWNNRLLDVTDELGYPYVILWSIDPADWKRPGEESVYRSIVDRATPGAIVLQHGHPPENVLALPRIVRNLRARGYQFVTLSEILGLTRQQRDFGGDTYVVQLGDDIGRIAQCHNIGMERLQAYNRAQTYPVGTELSVPHQTEVVLQQNGERLSFPVYPRLVDGRILAHVRLAERLGGEVTWDGTATHIRVHGWEIVVTPGERTALVNGERVEMPAAAAMVDGRVLLPVRFLVEHAGAGIHFDPSTYVVEITQ